MQNLSKIFSDLNAEQIKHLREKFKGNRARLKLIDALLEMKDNPQGKGEDFLVQRLGYEKNKGAFYTLTHRFIKDISHFKIQIKKNQLSETEARISNLRLLLYSKDHHLFELEAKDLKKKVQELEIKRGVYEVYFCEYLFHYADPVRREAAIRNVFKELEDEKKFLIAEMEFYRIILEFQDLFFSCNVPLNVNPDAELSNMRKMYEELPLKTLEFFLLSCELTFHLRINSGCNLDAENDKRILRDKINRLYYLFENFQMNYRFPNCQFAISCLFSKHDLVSGDINAFERQIKALEGQVDKIIGFKTYENVLFYFFWAKCYLYIQKNELSELNNLFKDLTKYIQEGLFSKRIIFYMMHLECINEIYQKNYRKAVSLLIKARDARKFLGQSSLWIQAENALLLIALHIKMKDFRLAEHELGYLVRILKNGNFYTEDFRDFVRFIRAFLNNPLRVIIDLQQSLYKLKEKTGLLTLFSENRPFL
ncbi:MAG: hypothetical protein N2050_03700 [Flavobacteriales bacterium]|nr:hypothetical protein [Flavobacteriales bacterium]